MNDQILNERPFAFQEIFFSRTDFKGKVLSGNKVFQRVSGYNWGEMSGRAHSIIRHSDVPKGVFHLFWSFLEKKKPIGAYVKNKAKDGRHYWVFAVAVPLEDGYLSVRIKPSSPLFEVIQSAYSELKKKELNEKISPEISHQALLDLIRSLGYKSYESLMTDCFLLELDSRQKKLGLDSIEGVALLKQASELAASLRAEIDRVFQSLEGSKFLPLNLEITSAHLSEEGAALAVVASSYQKLSQDVQNEIRGFRNSAENVILRLQENQFLMSTKYLMMEMVTFFKTESGNDEMDSSDEARRLIEQSEKYQNQAKSSVIVMIQSLKDFKIVCESVKSLVTGLEIMRLTGKIEAARFGSLSESINVIIGHLKQFQGCLLSILNEIDESRQDLEDCATKILEESEKF